MAISAKLVKELREKTGAGMMDCKKALEACDGDIEASFDWLREKGIAKSAKKADRIAAEGLSAFAINGNVAAMVEVNSETDFVAKNAEFVALVNNVCEAVAANNPADLEAAKAIEVDGKTIETTIAEASGKIGEKLSLRRVAVVEKTDEDNFGAYLHLGGRIAVLSVIKGGNEEIAKDVSMQAAAMKPQYVFKEDVPAEVVEKEKEILKTQAMEEGKPAEIAEKMVAGRINKFFKEICLTLQSFIKDGDVDVETYLKNNNATLVSMVRYEVGEGIEKKEENFAEEVMNQIKNN